MEFTEAWGISSCRNRAWSVWKALSIYKQRTAVRGDRFSTPFSRCFVRPSHRTTRARSFPLCLTARNRHFGPRAVTRVISTPDQRKRILYVISITLRLKADVVTKSLDLPPNAGPGAIPALCTAFPKHFWEQLSAAKFWVLAIMRTPGTRGRICATVFLRMLEAFFF
jgi:hypothetical protein